MTSWWVLGIRRGRFERYWDRWLSCRTPAGNTCSRERYRGRRFWCHARSGRFDDFSLAWLLLRKLDFVEGVLAHDVIIQLGFALAVETEPTDFLFDFTALGLVPIILRASWHEFHNVVVSFQISGELSEVASQGRAGLIWLLEVNDRVGVEIEHAFTQQFQSLVEMETHPTGGLPRGGRWRRRRDGL